MMMTTRDASKRTTEITQVRRGTTVDALPHEHSNLEVDTLTDSKPVELSQDRSDVFSTGRAANQTSSCVLDGL